MSPVYRPTMEQGKDLFDKATQLLETFDSTPIDRVKTSIETLLSLSYFLRVSGHLNEACQIDSALVDVTKRIIGDQHEQFARTLFSYGKALDLQGRFSEALDCYDQSRSLFLQLFGEQHQSCPHTRGGRGDHYTNKGNMSRHWNTKKDHSKSTCNYLERITLQQHKHLIELETHFHLKITYWRKQ